MSDYTPSTDAVRRSWVGGLLGPYAAVGGATFDRWLDTVRAEAWDEAIDEAEGCGWIHDYVVTEMHARNPYKEQP